MFVEIDTRDQKHTLPTPCKYLQKLNGMGLLAHHEIMHAMKIKWYEMHKMTLDFKMRKFQFTVGKQKFEISDYAWFEGEKRLRHW